MIRTKHADCRTCERLAVEAAVTAHHHGTLDWAVHLNGHAGYWEADE